MNILLIFLIKIYCLLISPLLGQNCRFTPTCSQYATEALYRYNVIKALYVISIRLLKCQPFHPGGFDPLDNNPKTN